MNHSDRTDSGSVAHADPGARGAAASVSSPDPARHAGSGSIAHAGSGSANSHAALGRLPLLDPAPTSPWGVHAFLGEVVPFRVTAFREGRGIIGVDLRLISPSGVEYRVSMSTPPIGTDRWHAQAELNERGRWNFFFRAYSDEWASWREVADIKVPAGVDVEVVLAQGSHLAARAADEKSRRKPERHRWAELEAVLKDVSLPAPERLAAAHDAAFTHDLAAEPLRGLISDSESFSVYVERERAGSGAWYEFFPRSVGAHRQNDGSWVSGTFRSAETLLPQIAEMGFNVVYLPPIHPIGLSGRKGRNNSTHAEPGDPGSPWAIGSADGGHDAIHPELGVESDFQHFAARAAELGLEVALDLALQASPDHPWVHEHPEWFLHQSDGSIAYAENPPKKYEDIYPLDFDADPDGLYAEVLRIVRHWMALGVCIFRVDNPHTKPALLWQRLIAEVGSEQPDAVFLAEAFTRPDIMNTLAKAGFQQSYSYFTWRNTKQELEEFFTTISSPTISLGVDEGGTPDDGGGSADFLRPNLFVNTPDILTEYLQFGGRPAFKIRAALAATAAPLWGMYSGFEFFEAVARPGAEEYIDNEKYEFRPRDVNAAGSNGDTLIPYLTMLNQARADHPCLGQLRNLRLHGTEDDAIIAYSKHLPGRFVPGGLDDTILVVANLDPHSVRETLVHLNTELFGIPQGESFEVRDLVTGNSWTWRDTNYVRLDAFVEPVHILHVRSSALAEAPVDVLERAATTGSTKPKRTDGTRSSAAGSAKPADAEQIPMTSTTSTKTGK